MLKEKFQSLIKSEDGKSKKNLENAIVFVIILVVTIIIINTIWGGNESKKEEKTTSGFRKFYENIISFFRYLFGIL